MKPSGIAVAASRPMARARQGRVCQELWACAHPGWRRSGGLRSPENRLGRARRPEEVGDRRHACGARQPRPQGTRSPRAARQARTASGTDHPGFSRQGVGRRSVRHRRVGGQRQPGHDRGLSTRTPALLGLLLHNLESGFHQRGSDSGWPPSNPHLGQTSRAASGCCITIYEFGGAPHRQLRREHHEAGQGS